MKNSKNNWLEKQVDRIPSKHKGTLFIIACFFFVVLQMVTQISCLDTLLPICIPWMYYQYVVYSVLLLPYGEAFIRKYFKKNKNKKEEVSDSYIWKIAVVIIIVPAIIFLPNRYIPIEDEIIYKGVVVDQTTASVNKSPSSDINYDKIQIIGEDVSFWYWHIKSKPNGKKCLISVRRGIFGMRCVSNVDFVEE